MAAAMGLGTIAKGLSIGAATGLAAFSVKKLSTNDQGEYIIFYFLLYHSFPCSVLGF